MNKEEIWKNVVGYEGLYEVSNFGNVRSMDRYVVAKDAKNPRFYFGTVLSPIKMNSGYLAYRLHKNGELKVVTGHRIVATAFIENTEDKPQVNHINEVKTDNRVENLEWVTAKENVNHSKNTKIQNNIKKYIDCNEFEMKEICNDFDEILLDLTLFNLIGKYKLKDDKFVNINAIEIIVLNYIIQNLTNFQYDCYKDSILCFEDTNKSIAEALNMSDQDLYIKLRKLIDLNWIKSYKIESYMTRIIVVNEDIITKYKNRIKGE